MAMRHESSPDIHSFECENGALRTIIAELLTVNQELRWRLVWNSGHAQEKLAPIPAAKP